MAEERAVAPVDAAAQAAHEPPPRPQEEPEAQSKLQMASLSEPQSEPQSEPRRQPAARKRSLKFLKQHELKFALAPVTRDAETGDVALALCLFCKHFGREERAGRKRRATANLKFFRKSFRTDQYVQHHASQHAALWARYEKLSDADKRAFFPTAGGRAPPPAQARQQLRARSPNEVAASTPSRRERRCCFRLDAPVLDLALRLSAGEALSFALDGLSPAEVWLPAPGAFRAFDRADDEANTTPTAYQVVVRSREELDAVVELLAGGLSFPQVAHTLRWVGIHANALLTPPESAAADETRSKECASAKRARHELSQAPQINSKEQTADFARLASAANLQMTSQLLRATWAIGVDLCAHGCVAERPFVDVRLRFFSLGKVRSAHLVALPALERPFEPQLFRTLDRALSAVLPDWRRRVIGISAHGDAKVLARVQDTAAWLARQIPAGARVYHADSARYELHAVLLRFYSSLQGSGFVPVMRLMVTCIRRSPELMEIMGSEPPSARYRRVTCADWMIEVLPRELQWISARRKQLVNHIYQHKIAVFERCGAAQDPSWWLFLVAVSHIAERSLEILDQMRARTSCRDQAPLIQEFAKELTATFEAENAGAAPLNAASADPADRDDTGKSKVFRSHSGRVAIRTDAMRAFVLRDGADVVPIIMDVAEAPMVDMAWENLSLCAANMIETLADLSKSCRARSGSFFNPSSSGSNSSSSDASAEDESSVSVSTLPPVTPRALAGLTSREFSALIQAHTSQLREYFSSEELDVVDQEHQALRRASTREAAVKDALATSNASREDIDGAEGFTAAWTTLSDRFPLLQAFAGGLASARPSDELLLGIKQEGFDCTLESRSSRLDDASELAADFALESALHAQQFAALSALMDAVEQQETVL